MRHHQKTRTHAARPACIAIALSVVVPIGGFWAPDAPDATADTHVFIPIANQPLNQTPIFAQDPGFVEPVFASID